MLLRIFCIGLFCLVFCPVFGQSLLDRDTLKSDYRVSGSKLDSVDCFKFNSLYSVPGTMLTGLPEFNIVEGFDPNGTLLSNSPVLTWNSSMYIALPHLGISYNFGSKGTQQMRAEYHQSFNKTNFLQVVYKNESTNGFLQNSAEKSSDVQIAGNFEKKRYFMKINAAYLNSSRKENGGVSDTINFKVQDLVLTGTNKLNANSFQKRGVVHLEQRFNFADSGSFSNGLLHVLKYDIVDKEYNETGLLSSIYDSIFHDSLVTRDHFSLASMANGFGYYFNSGSIYADVTGQHRYWSQYNIWRVKDTNEFAIETRVVLRKKNYNVSNEFKLNIKGALGEWRDGVEFKVSKDSSYLFCGKLSIGASLPTAYQRMYSSNNFQWNHVNLSVQNFQHLSIKMRLPKIKSLFTDLSLLNVINPWVFNGLNYQASPSSFSVLSVKSGISLSYKSIRVRPSILFQTGSILTKLPQFQGNLRIQFIQRWVKRRLPVSYGIDLSYASVYSTYSYLPVLNQFLPNNAIINAGGLLKVAGFFAIEVEHFRFYTRIENIDYAWNDRQRKVSVTYPVLPMQIRIGITWDFFN
jgi:hypothetical protein